MTDFITTRAEPDSNELRDLTRNEEEENAERFLMELDDLGCEPPTILTFGARAHGLVLKYVPTNRRHGQPIPLPHYSWRKLNRPEDCCREMWRCLPSTTPA